MDERRFWKIVNEYPEKIKGYEIGRFDEYAPNEYCFHDGMVTFFFMDERELRAILEDFIQDN